MGNESASSDAARWWSQHWDDLRYVQRVLEGRHPTAEDLRNCLLIVRGWREAIWQHGYKMDNQSAAAAMADGKPGTASSDLPEDNYYKTQAEAFYGTAGE